MANNDKLLSYTLSVGFILLILVFLIAMIEISRYTLTDSDHVSQTKNLLSDIQEVEQSVGKTDTQRAAENLEMTRYSNIENHIQEVSTLNIADNKSIISIVLNKPIEKNNNFYYITLDDISDLQIGDNILFESQDSIKSGKIYDIEQNTTHILDFQTKEESEVIFDNIIGKIILKFEDKND